MPMLLRLLFVFAWMLALGAGMAHAQEAQPFSLINLADPSAASLVKPNENLGDTQFTVDASGIHVTVKAEGQAGYPGVAIAPPEGKPWDLSAYGHVEARITNTGESRIYVHVRVDNPGHHSTQPWNTEAATIDPGATATVKVIFGYAYGYKPSYKLDSSKVSGVLVFTGKSKTGASFRIESLTAGGQPGEQPPVNPAAIRHVPENGIILGSGVDIAKQFKIGTHHATATVGDGIVDFALPAHPQGNRVALRPAVGRYNLRNWLQVDFTIRNTGDAPLSLRAGLESDKGKSDLIATPSPIPPGQAATITVPFRGQTIWQGPQELEGREHFKGTGGTEFASNVVSGLVIEADASDAARSFRVESITASMPQRKPLPEWLGKRPPVEGDWTLTFEDNFDGDAIDFSRWSIYTSNFWDKRSHFSKDNVILGDGVVRLRFEKKTGPHNDDPEGNVTDYATGFLHTYGKWTQRYGYFEARMKLPEAPGMWPAFWLMPDRGVQAGPQWVRADTKNGGMEFDIMEYLSRWGPNRNSVAFHWDGYQKEHKATGTAVYVQPDEEGYITSGLLWLPGLAVVYFNGEEVARWESPRISNVPSYPIFTAVSGGWDNDPIDDSQLPSDFIIDYIRVWQRADLASEVDGPKPNDGKPHSG